MHFLCSVFQPNPKKLMIAQRVREVFESNSMVVVFQYNDMNCKEWDELRFALSSNEVSVKVFPNKVTCKALEDTVYHAMSPLFLSSTCVMYSEEPKIKAMVNAAKQQPKLELLGAKVDDRLLSRQDIAGYAKLPPKDELYVELVQLLSKPALRMSMLLQQNQSKLSSNLSAYAKQ